MEKDMINGISKTKIKTRFLIFSDDLCPDQVGFFGKMSKAKYEKEWHQYTGM